MASDKLLSNGIKKKIAFNRTQLGETIMQSYHFSPFQTDSNGILKVEACGGLFTKNELHDE
jgi:hypothetical protein